MPNYVWYIYSQSVIAVVLSCKYESILVVATSEWLIRWCILDCLTGQDPKPTNQGPRGRAGSKDGLEKEGPEAGQAGTTKRKEATGKN